jgi:hypothetical protein
VGKADIELPGSQQIVHVCIPCFDAGDDQQESFYWSHRKQLALEVGQELLDLEVPRDPLMKAFVKAGAESNVRNVIKSVPVYLEENEVTAYIDNQLLTLKEMSNLQFRKLLELIGDEVTRRQEEASGN